MKIAFYMDEHVHRAITLGLRIRDVDALTVQEDNRVGLADTLVLDRATELNRIVVSQDSDFLVEAQRRQAAGADLAGVIYAHQLQISIGNCIRDLELIAKLGQPEEFINRVQFLPL
jgi:hypothetical protein